MIARFVNIPESPSFSYGEYVKNDRQIIRIKDNTLIAGIDKDNPRTRIALSELKHPKHYQLDPWLHKKYLAGEYETSFEVID